MGIRPPHHHAFLFLAAPSFFWPNVSLSERRCAEGVFFAWVPWRVSGCPNEMHTSLFFCSGNPEGEEGTLCAVGSPPGDILSPGAECHPSGHLRVLENGHFLAVAAVGANYGAKWSAIFPGLPRQPWARGSSCWCDTRSITRRSPRSWRCSASRRGGLGGEGPGGRAFGEQLLGWSLAK